jgi:hypothetical protein
VSVVWSKNGKRPTSTVPPGRTIAMEVFVVPKSMPME